MKLLSLEPDGCDTSVTDRIVRIVLSVGVNRESCDLPILRLEKQLKKWYNKFGKHIFADCSLCHTAKNRRTRFRDGK